MNFVLFSIFFLFFILEEIVRGIRFAFVLLSYRSKARRPNLEIWKISHFQRDFKKEKSRIFYSLPSFSRKMLFSYNENLLPSSWFSGGDIKASKLTLSWNSTPRIKATLSNIHWSCRMLMWSMEPAQNFPKNFFAPRARRSWITKGHRWSTLFLDIRSRFSTTTTFAPNNCASIAERRPHGPPPMINTWNQSQSVLEISHFV